MPVYDIQMFIPFIIMLILALVLTATDQRYLFSLRKFLIFFSIGLIILLWVDAVPFLTIIVVILIYAGVFFMPR